MRINVSDIPDDGLQRELELPIVINDSAKPDVAHVFVKIFRFGKKILVEGSLNISVLHKCSRCLKEFSFPMDVAFRDEYSPAEEFKKEEEQGLTDKELNLSYYSNDEIDISELIKEQVLLSVPMKPLCKPDCEGICPQCGTDLNKGSCECKAEELDPRLAPLQKFKGLIKDRETS
jgi:uncharacterized protein